MHLKFNLNLTRDNELKFLLTWHFVWWNMKFIWHEYFIWHWYHTMLSALQAIFFWHSVWLSFHFFWQYSFSSDVSESRPLMLLPDKLFQLIKEAPVYKVKISLCLSVCHHRGKFKDGRCRYGLGQWEEALHSNASSHWLSPYPVEAWT